MIEMGHLRPEEVTVLAGHPTLSAVRIGLGSDRKNLTVRDALRIPGSYGGHPWPPAAGDHRETAGRRLRLETMRSSWTSSQASGQLQKTMLNRYRRFSRPPPSVFHALLDDVGHRRPEDAQPVEERRRIA